MKIVFYRSFLKYIVLPFIAILLLLNIVILLCLKVPKIQEGIVKEVTKSLSEKTNSTITIDEFQLDLFDGVYVSGLYIEDLQKDTLAYINRLNVNYSLKNIYNEALTLKRVAIEDFTIKLSTPDDSSDYNFQFLIDAFASTEEVSDTTSTQFKLIVEEISLINGFFHHNILNQEETPWVFNPSHLRVDSINLQTNLRMELPSAITADIQNLSAKEKCGLSINKLEAPLQIGLDSLTFSLPVLEIHSGESAIYGKEICFNTKTMAINAIIENSSIIAKEFKCFAPQLDPLEQPILFSSQISGSLPQLIIEQLSLEYPNVLSIKAPLLSISDYTNWDNTNLSADIEHFSLKSQTALFLSKFFKKEMPPVLDSLLPCTLALKADGSLPNLSKELHFQFPLGVINSTGQINYQHKKNHIASHINLESKIGSLRPIIGDDLVEKINASFNLNIDWDLDKMPIAKLDGEINEATIFNYTYDTIKLVCDYDHTENLKLGIKSKDPNCDLDFQADIEHLLSDSMATKLSSTIRNFAPQKLHLSDSIPNYQIALCLHLDGVGMDHNRWNGKIEFDDLRLKNDSDLLLLKEICIRQSTSGILGQEGKELICSSPYLDANLHGDFQYENIYDCVVYNLKKYLPTFFQQYEIDPSPTKLEFALTLKETKRILDFFGVNMKLLGELSLKSKMNAPETELILEIQTPQIEIGKEQISSIAPTQVKFDTKRNGLAGNLTTRIKPNKEEDFSAVVNTNLFIKNDSIYNIVELGTTPNIDFLQGGLINCISFHPNTTEDFRTHISIKNSSIFLNGKQININPSELDILTDKGSLDKITIENLGISANKKPLLSVNGILSPSLKDTLNIQFDKLKLSTLLSMAYKTNIPADCQINGEIKSCAILSDNFRFLTRNFHVDSIIYDKNLLGDLTANAIWDNSKKGVFANLKFSQNERQLMNITGVVSPAKQQLKMKASLDSVPLEIAIPFINEYVSDLKGHLASDISIKGNFSDLDINGYIYLNDAQAKVNYTGVTYFISDSIKMDGNHLYAKNFKVTDNFNNFLLFNGDIYHEKFKKYNYKMSLLMKDFALLNNPKDRKKTAYGTFFANGRNLKLVGDETHAELTGDFSNSSNTSVHINLPETVTEANTYDNIVYVSSKEQNELTVKDTTATDNTQFDLYAKLNLGLTDQASFYVNIAEGAMIRGNGNLQIIYDDNKLSLYNRFTVNDGFLKIKISGLPTKKFSLQEGSYVDFIGDPMKLKFNATASYLLTADLNTLSNTFSSITTGSTRVPVSCDLSATGNLNDMQLSYNVSLPKAEEDLKQSVASIINTDNIKIKQFAYLIGVGMFNDPSGQVQSDAAMSFASSSLSSTLNNVLSNVLGDKVTIGTDINSSKEDMSDMEVGVSVSTKLANDKLLLSTNLGVQTQGNSNGNEATFLSDFDAEYLIGKTGMFRIKAYNHTNNDFYRTSNNTQGLGFSFVRESKELKSLFKIREEFRKKREDIEKNRFPHAPADSANITPSEGNLNEQRKFIKEIHEPDKDK